MNFWNNLPSWIPSFTSTAFIFGFILIYDKIIWKKIPLLLNVKDLSGRYKGSLISDFNPEIDIKIIIEITQTASGIYIRQFNNNNGKITKSESQNENIEKQKDGSFKISFAYKNDGIEVSSKVNEHKGFCVLRSSINKVNLEGFYFTNRNPATKGQIKVEMVS